MKKILEFSTILTAQKLQIIRHHLVCALKLEFQLKIKLNRIENEKKNLHWQLEQWYLQKYNKNALFFSKKKQNNKWFYPYQMQAKFDHSISSLTINNSKAYI